MRRVLLKEAKTVPQAVEAMKVLQVERKRGELPVLKRTPRFSEYAEEYLNFYKVVKDAKSESTIKCEEWHLRMWIAHLGDARLDKISRAMINGFIAKRQAQGKSGRTVNLDVVVLRNVLKRAVDDGWIKRLPTENMRPLKWTPKKRRLFTAAEIDNLCAKAPAASKNGAQLADYLRLMATCGSRMTETLRLKWADVNWDRRQLTIGADGRTKNRKSRVVDFNPALEGHLKDMFARRAPDSEWLFPSPQRGDRDEGSKSFRQSLVQARRLAGLTEFGFHDCRHHFVSYCVMSGIDFMTIARWAGHQDGGVLIGKVYGHLSNEHMQAQAQRIVFYPEMVSASRTMEATGATA